MEKRGKKETKDRSKGKIMREEAMKGLKRDSAMATEGEGGKHIKRHKLFIWAAVKPAACGQFFSQEKVTTYSMYHYIH